jgi:hypothetical protein
MFITISPEKILKTDDIIGIFDLDTASQTKAARDYFKRAEKEGRVKMSGSELPKSFVVLKSGETILSQYSAKILSARTKYIIR